MNLKSILGREVIIVIVKHASEAVGCLIVRLTAGIGHAAH